MRLPRKHSITRRAEFERVKRSGQAKVGRFLVLSTLEDVSLTALRTGFITSKRCGKAHDRVLLRRRFRALVQAHAPQFAESRRFLVTIGRAASAKASFAELEADWLQQAKRLRLFPKPQKTP